MFSQIISQVCPQTLPCTSASICAWPVPSTKFLRTSACMSMAHQRYLQLTQALDCCRILGMLHILDWDVLSTMAWEST